MQTQLFIDGRFVDAVERGTIDVLNPHDGAVIAKIAAATAADVDLAVEAATRAFPTWSAMPAAERGRLLLRLADAIEANADELARLESLDTGTRFAIRVRSTCRARPRAFVISAAWPTSCKAR